MGIFLSVEISKKKSLHYHELLMRMKITVVYFSHAAFFLQIFPENLYVAPYDLKVYVGDVAMLSN